MKQRVRVVLVSTAVSATVGAGFAAAVVLASETQPILPRLSIAMVADLAAIAIFSSVFVSVPLGVAGGLFAGSMLRRHGKSMPAARWPARGGVAGMACGSVGGVVYLMLLSGGALTTELAGGLAMIFIVGAACGAVSGALVGMWCACEVSRASQATG